MRYRVGFEDGSGKECVVDTESGYIVAVTNWGCSCCKDSERDTSATTERIVNALNNEETHRA